MKYNFPRDHRSSQPTYCIHGPFINPYPCWDYGAVHVPFDWVCRTRLRRTADLFAPDRTQSFTPIFKHSDHIFLCLPWLLVPGIATCVASSIHGWWREKIASQPGALVEHNAHNKHLTCLSPSGKLNIKVIMKWLNVLTIKNDHRPRMKPINTLRQRPNRRHFDDKKYWN